MVFCELCCTWLSVTFDSSGWLRIHCLACWVIMNRFLDLVRKPCTTMINSTFFAYPAFLELCSHHLVSYSIPAKWILAPLFQKRLCFEESFPCLRLLSQNHQMVPESRFQSFAPIADSFLEMCFQLLVLSCTLHDTAFHDVGNRSILFADDLLRSQRDPRRTWNLPDESWRQQYLQSTSADSLEALINGLPSAYSDVIVVVELDGYPSFSRQRIQCAAECDECSKKNNLALTCSGIDTAWFLTPSVLTMLLSLFCFTSSLILFMSG